VCGLLAQLLQMDVAKGLLFAHPEIAELANASWQCSSETNYFGLSPTESIFFFSFLNIFILTNTQLIDAVTHPLFNYVSKVIFDPDV
jgi:hypothetical protein